MNKIDWDSLRKAAMESQANAYAPYSHFRVGAALLADGRIFQGCNVENAAYPVGICAERAALAQAVSSGCRHLEALVLVTDSPATPCGMCRQALVEFNQELPILMVCDKLEAQATLGQLLPDPFVVE